MRTFSEPKLKTGERYVARVINFAATEPYDGKVIFQGPADFERAKVERWTLTCETQSGDGRESRKLRIDRGERKRMDLRGCACDRSGFTRGGR